MGLNSLVVGVQGLVMVPLYLHALGARVYGSWIASGEVLNVLQQFDLGLTNVVTQRAGAAHARDDRQLLGEVLGTGILALTLVGGFLAATIIAVSFGLGPLFHLSSSEAALLRSCFQLAAVSAFFFVANFSAVGLARGMQRVSHQNAAMVAGSIVGFGTSFWLIEAGAGLWAIPVGFCMRTGLQLVVSVVLIFRLRSQNEIGSIRLTRAELMTLLALSPATTLGGVGYLISTQIEGVLVGWLLGASQVAVLAITRRAIDLVGSVLNTLAYSAYAGFAHLVSSPDRHRSRRIHDELLALWTALAVSAAAGYVAVNHSLVVRWTNADQFGGAALTCLIGAQFIVTGRLQLSYFLYRAAGNIVRGSLIQFAEAIARIALAIALIRLVGLTGSALSGIAVGIPVGLWLRHRTCVQLDQWRTETIVRSTTPAIVEVIGLMVCASAGVTIFLPDWPSILTIGLVASASVFGVLLFVDRRLDQTRDTIRRLGIRAAAQLRLSRS